MISAQLIEKLLRNECSSEEKEVVYSYLKDHPEVLNDFLSAEMWEKFQTSQPLDGEISERIHAGVHQTLFYRKRRLGRIVKLSIAASLILIIGLGWMGGWFKNNHSKTDSTGSQTISMVSWIERVNTSKKDSIINLPDSTVAIMKSQSRIRYREPFAWNNRRNVIMEGIVSFHVAKNKLKPFTVFTGDIATTALGTVFTVDHRVERNTIIVTLNEGKVVVSSSDSLHKKMKEDYFLVPGDQLLYNRETAVASLVRGHGKEVLVKAGNSMVGSSQKLKPDWYTFSGTKLSEVFDQLSEYYQVDIYYYPSDVTGKYFAGSMKKTDSLDNILNDIAVLNRLTISKKNGGYIIKKKIF
jgi:transmembrane sensor